MEPLRKIDKQELEKMRRIHEVFRHHIAESPNMEVFDSEKFGFFVVYVDDRECEELRPEVVDTAEELYYLICHQIARDILFSLPNSPDYLWELTDVDRKRILAKIEKDTAFFPEYAQIIEELFDDPR